MPDRASRRTPPARALRAVRTATVIALAIVSSGLAVADEGRTPVWESGTISAAGSYVLTRDVTQLTIGASNVDLDLNGFTVATAGGVDAIAISGVDNVTVRNGKIDGGPVTVSSSRNVRVERLAIRSADDAGIAVSGSDNFVVRDNVVIESQQAGISVDGCFSGTIEGNLLQGSGVLAPSAGIAVTSGSGSITIEGNRLDASSSSGIDVADCTDCAVIDNVVTSSGSHGINVDGTRVHVRGNVSNGNSAYGLRLDGSSNTYGGNAGRGNGGGVDCPVAAFSTELCLGVGGHESAGDNLLPGSV